MGTYYLDKLITKTKVLLPFVDLEELIAQRYAFLSLCKLERAIRLDFDAEGRLINEELLAIGTEKSVPMSASRVFSGAIRNKAHEIVVLHNHPGSTPDASKADYAKDQELVKMGDRLGIPVTTNVVVGRNGRYFSHEFPMLQLYVDSCDVPSDELLEMCGMARTSYQGKRNIVDVAYRVARAKRRMSRSAPCAPSGPLRPHADPPT